MALVDCTITVSPSRVNVSAAVATTVVIEPVANTIEVVGLIGMRGPKGEMGDTGPQGATGPQGPTGESVTTQGHEAGANLSGHRAIRVSGGLAYVADGTTAAHAGRCIGISTGAAVQGDGVTVQTAGALTEPSWTWTDGAVFVGASGVLTQSLAGLAFIQQIGVATSATSIDINPQLPVLIS